jgi:hypothetical protein
MRYNQDQWNDLILCYPPGTVVSGTVRACQRFGVFVDLDVLPDVPALLEVIHFAQNDSNGLIRPIKFPEEYPKLHSRISCRILAWCANTKDVRLTQLSTLDWIHKRRDHDPKESEREPVDLGRIDWTWNIEGRGCAIALESPLPDRVVLYVGDRIAVECTDGFRQTRICGIDAIRETRPTRFALLIEKQFDHGAILPNARVELKSRTNNPMDRSGGPAAS